jgi:hypothetical protein
MKVRILIAPTGYISFSGGPLGLWPKAGEVVDLPDQMAADLIAAGNAEKVLIAKATQTVETRPAPKTGQEERGEKRSGKG